MIAVNGCAIFTGRRPKHIASFLAIFAVLTVCVFASGCVSVPISGNRKSEKPVSTTHSFLEEKANEVDEIIPVVRGKERHFELEFNLCGSFHMEDVSVTRIDHGSSQRLAFGFFPGAASDEKAGRYVGTAFMSIWYNILFCGMPTLSGLFVEPFIPAKQGKGSRFSRSALIGFHRWGAGPHAEYRKKIEHNTKSTVRLGDYSCTIDGVPHSSQAGVCMFDHAGKTVNVVLSFDPAHPLKKQLAPFEGKPMLITLPRE